MTLRRRLTYEGSLTYCILAQPDLTITRESGSYRSLSPPSAFRSDTVRRLLLHIYCLPAVFTSFFRRLILNIPRIQSVLDNSRNILANYPEVWPPLATRLQDLQLGGCVRLRLRVCVCVYCLAAPPKDLYPADTQNTAN